MREAPLPDEAEIDRLVQETLLLSNSVAWRRICAWVRENIPRNYPGVWGTHAQRIWTRRRWQRRQALELRPGDSDSSASARATDNYDK
jgi:hypothetical protein